MKSKDIKSYILNIDFKQIILSDSVKGEYKKVNIRPVVIKDTKMYQVASYKDNKVFHKNLPLNEFLQQVELDNFNQILVEQYGKSVYFNRSKVEYKQTEKSNNYKPQQTSLAHNKTKQYLLNEGDNIPAMVELGVFTKDNKIVRTMYDKFKQINRFIEIVDDAFKTYNKKEITILDFGCGKSYLTFLIYHYFVNIKKIKAKIVGYDIKKDVVDKCNTIAKKYNCQGLQFIVSDVSKDALFNG